MGSLIPGYEYDIFISYRQKDNKHNGWVTEFVNNLKGELESTFKEEISVYFDINPHDGLLGKADAPDHLSPDWMKFQALINFHKLMKIKSQLIMKKSKEALMFYILNLTLILSFSLPELIYAQDNEIKPPIASKVKDGIYVHKSGNTNLTISSGDDGLLIVDTGVTNRAAKSDSLIRNGFKKSIKYILNTHSHFDHVQGNNVFAKDGAIIISSVKTREGMMQEWKVPEIPGVNFPVIPPYPPKFLPEICFNDSIEMNFNNEVIKFIHVPGGHSDGDAIVFFTKSNVIHMGDLFLTGAFPPITDIKIYINVLEHVIETCDEKTIIIPGHGNVSDKNGLISYKELISTAAKRVLSLKSEGRSFEEILAAKPITDLLENSWIPESLFIYCIYYKPKI